MVLYAIIPIGVFSMYFFYLIGYRSGYKSGIEYAENGLDVLRKEIGLDK